ncbi:MAG TPA: serine/threonine-protein kinase [Blastocatellia bacterium]|nr:serine/threonine-protein kinase [Blastocatellia bacterium]
MNQFVRTQFHTYILEQQLGEGAFGYVFRAVRQRDGMHVAVKFLKSRYDQEALQRFEAEAVKLYRLLSNVYVVNLLDYNLIGGQPFIVLEFCSGGSLRQWVVNRRSWRDVVAAMTHVAAALGEVHARGGVHRDIKPDNLLITRDGNNHEIIKLSDFGLAQVPTPSDPRLTRTPCGTPEYMAPELFNGASCSPASDVFSLGVTMTELLTGMRSRHSLKLMAVPAELKTLLLAMVDREPNRRPDINKAREQFRQIHAAPDPTFLEILGETVKDVAPYAAVLLLAVALFGKAR